MDTSSTDIDITEYKPYTKPRQAAGVIASNFTEFLKVCEKLPINFIFYSIYSCGIIKI